MRSLCALLAIFLGASSCSHPASKPVAAAVQMPTGEQIDEGVAQVEYHGIPGMFFTFEAWRNVIIRMRLQQKDLELALATSQISQEIAEAEAKRLRESQSRAQWSATYGPWLGFAGGMTAAAIIAGILGGVFKR